MRLFHILIFSQVLFVHFYPTSCPGSIVYLSPPSLIRFLGPSTPLTLVSFGPARELCRAKGLQLQLAHLSLTDRPPPFLSPQSSVITPFPPPPTSLLPLLPLLGASCIKCILHPILSPSIHSCYSRALPYLAFSFQRVQFSKATCSSCPILH